VGSLYDRSYTGPVLGGGLELGTWNLELGLATKCEVVPDRTTEFLKKLSALFIDNGKSGKKPPLPMPGFYHTFSMF